VKGKKTPPSTDPATATATATGDASADHGSIANSGVINGNVTINYPRAAPAPVSWPHRVGVVPRRADCFQHRAPVDQLAAAVGAGGAAVLCQVLAGMGGVGKTQLAADYAHQVWGERAVDR